MRFFVFGLALTLPLLAASPGTTQWERVPAWFEPHGQGEFVSRGSNGTVLLGGNRAQFLLPGEARLEMRLAGSRAEARWIPEGMQGGKTQYFSGSSKTSWRNDVAQYARVRQVEAYPGIDLVYYASGKHLEYDFVVAPGADATAIRMRFSASAKPRLDADGNLILKAGKEEIRHLAPVVYQTVAGQRREVSGSYRIARSGEVSFVVGVYDREQALVIDPVLTYASYLGGSKLDTVAGAALDRDGNLWLTGTTSSQIDIPGGTTPLQPLNGGESDAYLARISTLNDGTPQLTYYAYLGGSGSDESNGISIDPNGYIYITGTTLSPNFPLAGNAPYTSGAGETDAFIAQFHPNDPGAESLFFSTYYGGPGTDVALAVTSTADGAVITGYSLSGELPKATGFLQQSNRGGYDAFVARFLPLKATPEVLSFSTFYGGSGMDTGNAIVSLANGTVIVAGFTSSQDLPVAGGPYQDQLLGRGNGFLVRLDTTRGGFDSLQYGTYLGGNDLDSIEALRLDATGAGIWLGGYTFSQNFPVTPGAAQNVIAGGADAFIARFDFARNNISYATYLGGSGSDVVYGLALDSRGKPVFTGYTTSRDFPAIQSEPRTTAAAEAFVAIIDPARTGPGAREYSATFGGGSVDTSQAIALDSKDNIYIAGSTSSPNIPVTIGGGKPSAPGVRSGFYVRLNSTAPPSVQ